MKTFIKKTIAIVTVMAIALTLAMPMQAEAATKAVKPTITVTKKTKSASLKKVKTGSYKLTTVTGASIQFKAKAGKSTVTKKATWKSSNTKVVSVTKAGKLTAKKVGSAKVTCTYKGKKTTLNVTVKCSGHKWVKHYVTTKVPDGAIYECDCGQEFTSADDWRTHSITAALNGDNSHAAFSATDVYKTEKVCDYTYCSVCGAHK